VSPQDAPQTAPEPLVEPKTCPYVFAVVRATLRAGGPGLRLACEEPASGRRWLHQTVLPSTEGSSAALVGLAFRAGSAWAAGGWSPQPPHWTT